MLIRRFLILALLTQNPVDLYNSARADMEAGRWAEAAKKYEQAIREDPTHIPTLFNLAVCYTRLGERKRATELYLELLKRDAGVFEARINLALLLEESGDFRGAAEQTEQAIALRPNDADLYAMAASLLEAAEEFDRARDRLLAAEAKGLRTAQIYAALSDAELRRKDEVKSREYLEKAAELDPTNRRIQRQLGVAYARAGDYNRAAAALKPLLPETAPELAEVYFSSKNYPEAAELFRELTQREPGNAEYFFMLGRSHMELKQLAPAAAALRKAVELRTDFVEAYGALGSVLAVQEDWTGAAAVLGKFLELRPGVAGSHFLLAISLDRLGNAKEALYHYNKFLEIDRGADDVRSFQARQRIKALEERLKR